MNPKVRESLCLLMDKNESTVDFLREWLEKDTWNTMETIGVASVVANIYNGIETVLELLIRKVHDQCISGGNWHKELIRVARELGYIPDDILDIVSSMRDFRHFKRHGYDIDIDLDQIREYAPDAIKAHLAIANCILSKHPTLKPDQS